MKMVCVFDGEANERQVWELCTHGTKGGGKERLTANHMSLVVILLAAVFPSFSFFTMCIS